MDTLPELADALFTRTQQRVLGLLYGNTAQSYYLNEIVRLAAIGKGTVTRELQRLAAAGILVARRRGNQVHYQANRACPIFHELQAIALKTFALADAIAHALEPFLPGIEQAFLHGAIAGGAASVDGEVDLLVVANEVSYGELLGCVAAAEAQLGRTINLTLYDSAAFAERVADERAPLARTVARARIWIKRPDGAR